MQPIEKGFFSKRTEEQIYFGSINKYSNDEVIQIVRNYLYDVVKFIFNEISDNQRIILPSQSPDKIDKLFSTKDITYYLAGDYIVFESKDQQLKSELFAILKAMFSKDFPTTHLKIGFPSKDSSTDAFTLTDNSNKFFELLPFPKYILWAINNPDKLKLKTNENTLLEWEKTKIKRIRKINIKRVNQDIITYSLDIDSNTLEYLWLLS